MGRERWVAFGLEGSNLVISELVGIGIVIFRVSVVYLSLENSCTGDSWGETGKLGIENTG